MNIIDAHCDVLSKMLDHPHLDFGDDRSGLDVTLPRLIRSRVMLQFFAIWMPDHVSEPNFGHVMRCVELFNRNILRFPQMGMVRTRSDLLRAASGECIGGMLTLEGVDALAGNLALLETLFQVGVRCVGITWNYANWAADGVLEPRNGGFTLKGRKLVKECNRLGIIVDVSHLAETGFWELAGMSDRPFVATHSNAYEVCGHPRNLKNDQIEHLIRIGGRIGINFYPPFVHDGSVPTIDDLLKHIDHICSLGGAGIVGMGSDFDGMRFKLPELEHAGKYDKLVNALLRHYRPDVVERFLHRNWFDFWIRWLPTN